MIEWILQNYEAIVAGAAAASTIGLPAIWLGVVWVASNAGDIFGQLMDMALEAGDDECDEIVLKIAAKIQKEIPDGIREDHPKIVTLSERWARGARFLKAKVLAKIIAAFLRSVDKRAKRYQAGR